MEEGEDILFRMENSPDMGSIHHSDQMEEQQFQRDTPLQNEEETNDDEYPLLGNFLGKLLEFGMNGICELGKRLRPLLFRPDTTRDRKVARLSDEESYQLQSQFLAEENQRLNLEIKRMRYPRDFRMGLGYRHAANLKDELFHSQPTVAFFCPTLYDYRVSNRLFCEDERSGEEIRGPSSSSTSDEIYEIQEEDIISINEVLDPRMPLDIQMTIALSNEREIRDEIVQVMQGAPPPQIQEVNRREEDSQEFMASNNQFQPGVIPSRPRRTREPRPRNHRPRTVYRTRSTRQQANHQ